MLTTTEYNRALDRIDILMGLDPAEGSKEGNELMALVDQVLEYEQQWFPHLFPTGAKPHAHHQG